MRGQTYLSNTTSHAETVLLDASKTPEGRSATFKVQGLDVSLLLFSFVHFSTSIAARFLVTFQKTHFLSRLCFLIFFEYFLIVLFFFIFTFFFLFASFCSLF